MMRTIFPLRAKDHASQPRVKIMRLSCCFNLGVSQPHVHNPRKRIISDQTAGTIMRIISTTASGCLRHDRVEGGSRLTKARLRVKAERPSLWVGGWEAPRLTRNSGFNILLRPAFALAFQRTCCSPSHLQSKVYVTGEDLPEEQRAATLSDDCSLPPIYCQDQKGMSSAL
jgi:hypothetical protein